MTPLFLGVMLANFSYFVCVGALQPTLPRFVEGPLGGGGTAVGIAVGSFALAAVLIRPFIGSVGDRRGRRPLIVLGGAIVGVSTLLYLIADSLPVLILLRLLAGVGEAAFYVGAASSINDIAPEERRGEAFSYFSLSLFGGLAVGPVIGETALEWGFPVAWIVAASGALIAALVGLRLPETRPAIAPEETRIRLYHPAALLPGSVLATSVWGLATFSTFVPLYALQLGMPGSRYVFVTYSIIVFSVRFFGARIPDRLGARVAARLSLSLSALGLSTIALSGNVVGLFVGTALYSLGHSLLFPALITLALSRAPAGERASVVGTFTAFFDLAFGVGAVSAGAVSSLLGYRGAFGAATFVALAGLSLLVFVARRARKQAVVATASL